jgi:tRNA A37 methylthiotransferase MiaB
MSLANKVSPEVIGERVAELSTLVDELITQRAEARIGQMVTVLIEDEDEQEGRADHQGPDVDGSTFVKSRNKYRVGEYVQAVVSDVMGVDLIAQVI